jgi:hypothetical protein
MKDGENNTLRRIKIQYLNMINSGRKISPCARNLKGWFQGYERKKTQRGSTNPE